MCAYATKRNDGNIRSRISSNSPLNPVEFFFTFCNCGGYLLCFLVCVWDVLVLMDSVRRYKHASRIQFDMYHTSRETSSFFYISKNKVNTLHIYKMQRRIRWDSTGKFNDIQDLMLLSLLLVAYAHMYDHEMLLDAKIHKQILVSILLFT